MIFTPTIPIEALNAIVPEFVLRGLMAFADLLLGLLVAVFVHKNFKWEKLTRVSERATVCQFAHGLLLPFCLRLSPRTSCRKMYSALRPDLPRLLFILPSCCLWAKASWRA